MSGIKSKLTLILHQLEGFSLPVVSMLQPGIKHSEITTALQNANLPSNEEIVELYSFKNGTIALQGITLEDMFIIPGFYLLSLNDALANYAAFKHDERWDIKWLPILANGGGDFYIADFAGGTSLCQIRHFRIEQAKHPVEFSSLNSFLSTVQAAYEQGVIFVRDSYLEMNDQEFAKLAATLNPDIDWWHE